MNHDLRHGMLVGALLAALPAAADSTIYRCHALNGTLLFQDRPCSRVASTLEAHTGQEGVLMPPPLPPADDGGAANARYARVLDQAERDRRAQAEADAAEAKRLRAEREAGAPAAAAQGSCAVVGSNGDCLDAFYPGYGAYPPPRQRPVVHPHPRPAPAPPAARRTPVPAADAVNQATRGITAIP